jgi:zinc transporter ZupT
MGFGVALPLEARGGSLRRMTIPTTASGVAAAVAAFIGLLLAAPAFALELARVPPPAHLRPS